MFNNYKELLKFYQGKRVLITGNTGFKGSWLTHILLSAGADVTGYALSPPTEPSLFKISGLDEEVKLKQIIGDIRDLRKVEEIFNLSQPEIVFHLAAQPIVRDSYRTPVSTYSTNVMGTVNVCESVRMTHSVKSFINVTTDKVYKNKEWEYGYRESDELDGLDPYSNSKSCSELVTHCYRESYWKNNKVRVSTARAGNVIGGGDFANDRIIPDCVRAMKEGLNSGAPMGTIIVRNAYSTRPYEHVLEPLFAYLMIAKAQYMDYKYSGNYNVGPNDENCVTTGELVDLFCKIWNQEGVYIKASWENVSESDALQESKFLRLDCGKLKSMFGWRPTWTIDQALRQTVKFTRLWLSGADAKTMQSEMNDEVNEFIKQNEGGLNNE